MKFTHQELGRLLEWFNTLDSLEPGVVKDEDRELSVKIADAWQRSTDSSDEMH